MLYADIIVDISHERLYKTYQYKIPEHLQENIQVGMPVVITFGNGNRRLTGYVVGLSDKPKIEEHRIKEIADLVDKGIPIESRMIVLAHWMKENFGGTMNDALRTVLSVKKSVKPVEKKNTFPFRHVLTRELGMLFGLTVLHGVWMGLCATYFVVYLLKSYGLSPSAVLWIEAGLCTVALFAGPYFGKLADRWGYPLTLTVCTGLMVLIGFVWVNHPGNTWIFILYSLLIYNGNGGFLAGMLRQSECIASVRLPITPCSSTSYSTTAYTR